MGLMILRDSEAKQQGELRSHCQTLNLRHVTVTYLYLFNVYHFHRDRMFHESSTLSTLALPGI